MKVDQQKDSARRVVYADVSENNFIAEAHGLSVGDRIRVDDDDEDVWDTLVGTSGSTSADWEAANTASAAFVRNVTADTFQLASANNDSFIYALTLDEARLNNIKVANENKPHQ